MLSSGEAINVNEGEPVKVPCQWGVPRYSIFFMARSHSAGGMVKGHSQADASTMVFHIGPWMLLVLSILSLG